MSCKEISEDFVMIHIFECGHVWRNENVPEKCPVCEIESDLAILKEENDLQRQAVKDLSCQVVQYRKVLKDIQNYFSNPKKYSGAWPEFYSVVIKTLLESSDPGARVKAVVEAATKLIKGRDEYGISWKCLMDLKQALATLEGDQL